MKCHLLLYRVPNDTSIILNGVYQRAKASHRKDELQALGDIKKQVESANFAWFGLFEVDQDVEKQTTSVSLVEEQFRKPPKVTELNTAAKRVSLMVEW